MKEFVGELERIVALFKGERFEEEGAPKPALSLGIQFSCPTSEAFWDFIREVRAEWNAELRAKFEVIGATAYVKLYLGGSKDVHIWCADDANKLGFYKGEGVMGQPRWHHAMLGSIEGKVWKVEADGRMFDSEAL